MLDDFGLCAAIERLVATFSARTGIDAEVDLEEGPERLPPDAELALFRIVQEALADIAAHADAHAVRVRLERKPGSALLLVQDDGRGFDPHTASPDEIGLVGARERLRLLGGRLTVTSAGCWTTRPHGSRTTARLCWSPPNLTIAVALLP